MDLLSLRKISFAKLPNQVSISPWPTDDGHVLMTLRERKGMNIHRVTTAWCGGENTEHPGPEGLVARAKSAALWLCDAGHAPTPQRSLSSPVKMEIT